MVKNNLETNAYFKTEMSLLGFKKKKNEFVKEYKDALHEIVWGHATHGEKHTRYYSCSCMVEYPIVSDIADKLDVIVYPIGTHIGYIMPKNRYVEWEIRESFDEKALMKVMNDIVKSIAKYAVPFMEKISTINDFIEAVEHGLIRDYDKKMPPIIYRLLGKEEKAQDYIKHTLNKLSEYKEPQSLFEYKETKDYCQITYVSPGNKNLEIYQNFARKFNESKDVFLDRAVDINFYPY